MNDFLSISSRENVKKMHINVNVTDTQALRL